MIDSHCHLDCELFDSDRAAVLDRARARGVTDIVVPAVGDRSWEPILALGRGSGGPRCHPALGLHPVHLARTDPREDEAQLAALTELAERGGIVAVGECGLDATVDLVAAPWSRQEHLLRAQLTLAARCELPVILHARGPAAYRRLGEIGREGLLPARGGVIHSYGGGVDLLRQLSSPNLYFGFAGPATYPDARKVHASIRAVPVDRLLAETDAPDQTPVPYRPGRSEPAYVLEVIAGMATARGETPAALAARTADNARRLFGLS